MDWSYYYLQGLIDATDDNNTIVWRLPTRKNRFGFNDFLVSEISAELFQVFSPDF